MPRRRYITKVDRKGPPQEETERRAIEAGEEKPDKTQRYFSRVLFVHIQAFLRKKGHKKLPGWTVPESNPSHEMHELIKAALGYAGAKLIEKLRKDELLKEYRKDIQAMENVERRLRDAGVVRLRYPYTSPSMGAVEYYTETVECRRCAGVGTIQEFHHDPNGNYSAVNIPCPACRGNGVYERTRQRPAQRQCNSPRNVR
jgi:hypothetical protein